MLSFTFNNGSDRQAYSNTYCTDVTIHGVVDHQDIRSSGSHFLNLYAICLRQQKPDKFYRTDISMDQSFLCWCAFVASVARGGIWDNSAPGIVLRVPSGPASSSTFPLLL
eukprot:gb/GECG01005928.1/.p1 GENE.gb/GECG01005928.1/~~gb/GECG01005928.1/.p1  ORF type:complete len:110 (+),score=5.95 gb/GECG01005928.1/:1-330(+)